MITLLISSIVISMGYAAYFLLNGQFARYRARVQKMTEYDLLATAWRNDFERSDAITDTLDNGHILFSRQDGLVRYSINSGYVLRESDGSRDSFPLRATVQDTWYADDTIRLIKGIRMNLELNGGRVLLIGAKTYSAGQLMYAQKLHHDE